MDLTAHWVGYASIAIFVAAYIVVAAEERLHLRKSIPVLVAAGAMWALIGVAYAERGEAARVAEAARHTLLEFGELFLFLIVAMTYVNTLDERGLFAAVRAWLVGRRLSLQALFWVTGAMAFAISPIVPNLTTALIAGAVAIAVGQGSPRFILLSCINVVVAANAGGAFSPFGDITTLMVWQEGLVPFLAFFVLFLPALVGWLVTALLLSRGIEQGHPRQTAERVEMETGAITIALLFLGTIAFTVAAQSALAVPPALGMMFGLGVLKLYGFALDRRAHAAGTVDEMEDVFASPAVGEGPPAEESARTRRRARVRRPLATFRQLERVEWDTLMFFYGVILCVGGLGALGYLATASRLLYDGLGATAANVLLGVLSAIVDNVPVMFAVLEMHPSMPLSQWLLATLTIGIGGSLLSFGSAAGVALMGQARGVYTFGAHLRWSWTIAAGYAASVAVHLAINGN